MCRKARTRWVEVAGKMENAYVRTAHALHEGDGFLVFAVDCRSSEKKKAACTTYFPYRTLNPNSRPVLSPRGRELERGQQAARLVLGRLELGCWERLPQFGECPLPPPPRGREQVTADSSVTGRLKKNARNINGRNFSGSLYHKADGANAASVFSDDL